MKAEEIRLLLVMADSSARESLQAELRWLRGFRVVGNFRLALDADLALGMTSIAPDVMILNNAPDTAHLKAHWPRLKYLVLAPCIESSAIVEILSAGADGVLPLSCSRSDLESGIARVAAGAAVLGDRVQEKVREFFARRAPLLPALSPIEREILHRFDSGESYKEIAAALRVSLNTVKTHAKRILVKSMATCARQASLLRALPV